jgi:hypothetical protein
MTDFFKPTNRPSNLHETLQYSNVGLAEMRVAAMAGPDAPLHVFVDNTEPMPVTLGSETITIIGNIAVPTTVNVTSTPTDPVHVHLTEVGSSGLLDVAYLPVGQSTSPWIVVGNVNIATTNGGIEVNNDTGNPLRIIGNVNTTVISTVSVTQGTSPWVVIGNTNITNTPTVALSSNAVTATQGTSPWVMSGNVNASITGTVTTTVVAGATDAFGRLRTSDGFTLGDYKHTYGIDPNFRDTLINGGTVTHIPNQAAARLATSNNVASRAIHQTKMYHNYMPGKSQLIESTINFYEATANVTKRTGYFDDLNGIYFEQTGIGELAFVIRTNTSGTPSDVRRVTQSQWNQNTCNTAIAGTSTDGSNYGVFGTWNLDITKTQIFWTDFQWLGVGRVRCGFIHNGETVVAHEFYNSNNLPVVYMANPNLPIRCEILNTGVTAGAFFDQICSTVISEGGYSESGIDFSINSGTTGQAVTLANGVYPILAWRLKNTFRGYPNRVVVRPGNMNIYAENRPAYWTLIKLDSLSNITLGSSTWTSADDDSAVEYNLTATAFTGGDRMDGGLLGTTSPGGRGTGVAPINNPSLAKKNFIAQNQDSTNSEIYVLCAQAIGGTTTVWCDVQWREIY